MPKMKHAKEIIKSTKIKSPKKVKNCIPMPRGNISCFFPKESFVNKSNFIDKYFVLFGPQVTVHVFKFDEFGTDR